MPVSDIERRLSEWARRFEQTLDAMLLSFEESEAGKAIPPKLQRLSAIPVQGGGKRVRAYIVTRICELCGGTEDDAAPAAVALECVHAFSLVHDDLPAMDNDDFRRGRPTCHKAYGEAVAILAGDALVALAFEILARKIPDARRASAAVIELADGTGWAGMIGGQTTDILSEHLPPDLGLVERIHRYKTARLFEAAGRLGAISAGAPGHLVDAAGSYGRCLGRSFQIADDLLDVTGDAALMGKAVAKDATAGKQTYPAIIGVEASQEAAQAACRDAIDALAVLGTQADDLRELARFVVARDR